MEWLKDQTGFGDAPDSAGLDPEELAGHTDDDLKKWLNKAAGEMQSAVVPALERLAGGDDPLIAGAAVRMLGMTGDEAAADALVRIRESSQVKAIRKEAGYSLHRLRSLGVQPRETPKPKESVLALSPVRRVERALAGYYDVLGNRILAMAVRPPGEPFVGMVWLISEEGGFEDGGMMPLSRRSLGEWADGLLAEPGMFEIDIEHARFLVKEAFEEEERPGVKVPEGYGLYLDAVSGMPDPPEEPIIYRMMDVEEVEADAAALASSFRLPYLSACSWRLDPDRMQPYFDRLRAVFRGVVVTSEAVRRERIMKIVSDAIDAEFTQELSYVYERRLEETAYLLLLDGKEKEARSAFAAALALASGKDPHDVPFVIEFIKESVGLFSPDSPRGRELAKHKAAAARESLVRPAFESRTIEGMLDEVRGALEEDEDDGYEDEDSGDTDDLPRIIDPRDPRQMR